MTIQCVELQNDIRKRLRKANLPKPASMENMTLVEVQEFDAIQEVIMCAVYDFAIKMARRELKGLKTK